MTTKIEISIEQKFQLNSEWEGKVKELFQKVKTKRLEKRTKIRNQRISMQEIHHIHIVEVAKKNARKFPSEI